MGDAAYTARKARGLFALVLLAAAALSPVAYAECADPFTLKPQLGAFNFKQVRTLEGFPRPLVSEGTAAISAKQVVWRIAKPVAVVTTITQGGITQSVDNGPARSVSGAAADPFLRSSGLFHILTGDFAALKTFYDIKSERNPNDWRLTLRPRDANMARFIAAIEVRGCAAPTDVNIQQSNGDLMSVSWSPPAN